MSADLFLGRRTCRADCADRPSSRSVVESIDWSRRSYRWLHPEGLYAVLRQRVGQESPVPAVLRLVSAGKAGIRRVRRDHRIGAFGALQRLLGHGNPPESERCVRAGD
jgi:hypothetical protein